MTHRSLASLAGGTLPSRFGVSLCSTGAMAINPLCGWSRSASCPHPPYTLLVAFGAAASLRLGLGRFASYALVASLRACARFARIFYGSTVPASPVTRLRFALPRALVLPGALRLVSVSLRSLAVGWRSLLSAASPSHFFPFRSGGAPRLLFASLSLPGLRPTAGRFVPSPPSSSGTCPPLRYRRKLGDMGPLPFSLPFSRRENSNHPGPPRH